MLIVSHFKNYDRRSAQTSRALWLNQCRISEKPSQPRRIGGRVMGRIGTGLNLDPKASTERGLLGRTGLKALELLRICKD